MLLLSASGHYSGTPGADRHARVVSGKSSTSEPLARWADVLFDPRRVEAEQAVVELPRARLRS